MLRAVVDGPPTPAPDPAAGPGHDAAAERVPAADDTDAAVPSEPPHDVVSTATTASAAPPSARCPTRRRRGRTTVAGPPPTSRSLRARFHGVALTPALSSSGAMLPPQNTRWQPLPGAGPHAVHRERSAQPNLVLESIGAVAEAPTDSPRVRAAAEIPAVVSAVSG